LTEHAGKYLEIVQKNFEVATVDKMQEVRRAAFEGISELLNGNF